ncbi:uncharacterized protein MONOS_8267 [Monocercomonoides exilis]|uniref:uncharacterized protein n=1 Tax=Monocercomonoides exilis TaxID=2049356 RepID=UPI003559E5A2|nr:hypothetical protein MONOS_8267 [Monocercomonoides exilis]|eukprot:MONOS_8267.1-p1 / transcript=MONOS_8267.1 / gene=MONOS_8267 / organism=Monocercomonoides_exilis_PA203 / gene_product=unspecified product / transcript_product=unspecified product / location=Mono_scaffold00307:49350-51770(-) / protein_length=546 / sequence_SO=supercontig / SO=protein_coding / is_pseudo=false
MASVGFLNTVPSFPIARERGAFAAEELLYDTKAYFKKLLVSRAAQESSLRSAPSSSSTGAARRSTSPFRRRRSEKKKTTRDMQSSLSESSIDHSDVFAVAASNTSAAVVDDIERRLRLWCQRRLGAAGVAIAAVEACGGEAGRGSDEVMGRWVVVGDCAGCPGGARKAKEGKGGGKEGEENGKEKGEEDGCKDGGREGGDGNDVKGGHSTAHRDTSSADGVQQEISRAEGSETEDVSLGIASEGSAEGMGKDEEQVEMSKNDLGMNEESGKEGSSIDLEKEEEEEEWQILDMESLHERFLRLVDESAYGSRRDNLVTMTVTGVLVELCAERERITGKPVVEGMIQPDGTMSITFIGERLFGRREKRREGGRERERMDEFVAIGAVVPQESVPSIALLDATYAIGQVCHGKGMIGVFSVSYCVFVDEWESLRMCAVDLSMGPPAASSAFLWMSYLLQGGIEIASGNYLLPHHGGTAALHVRAPSSDSAHSACARPQGCSSGAHRSTSQRQVAGVQSVCIRVRYQYSFWDIASWHLVYIAVKFRCCK